MSLSRRKFLRAGTLVALSAGIPLKTLVASTISQPSSFLPTDNQLNAGSYLNRESFSRQLKTKFSFAHLAHKERQGVSVELIEVNDLTPKTMATSGKECFAAVFIGPRNAPLRQETYAVTHESLGMFEMLVVPISSHPVGVYYEAIFNRLH
jgi:hypothetical protein